MSADPSDRPAEPQASPVTVGKAVEWATKHKVLTALGALLVFGAIGSLGQAGNGSPATDSAAASSSSAPASEAAPVSSPGPSADTKAALGWIHKNQHCWNAVQVAVQAVQADIAILGSSPDPSEVAAMSSQLQQSHDVLDDSQSCLVMETDGHMSAQRQAAWDAAYTLRDAMSAARHYLDDQKPSQLADFTDRYQRGVSEWNDAVTTLWDTAGMAKPPTL